ncbi:MAG: wax ester/triacylglycerol synthase family O-acyltransferase [Pseudomonadales bacterium]
MQQLTGLDASFLYLETANTPMHISSVVIYDPSTAPNGKVRFKEILKNTEARSCRVPSMTNVLVNVPMSLDHPYWRTEGSFDAEFHIRHMALPAPGDWRQLCILIARLHARPLDRSRPLWEMYIIEGLDNVEGCPKGSFAVFNKVHHAAVDGASSAQIAVAIHDLSPDYAVAKKDVVVIKPEKAPSSWDLIVKSQINSIKKPFRFLSVARNTIPGVARTIAGLTTGKLERITNIPRTRFSGTISPHRIFDAATFDFQEIRKIKNSVAGATVNDVALAICGGALRKYLAHHDELPEESLVAMAPVNLRTEDQSGTGGNQVTQMTVALCSDIEDAYERLEAVHEGTANAKQLTNAIGAKAMTDYNQFIPATLTASAARLASSWGLANKIKPAYNCVITNVPGPQIPLYYTGARMVNSYGLGPPLDGNGLFHVISSYCGQLNVSVTSCREMMPDPAFYVECIEESFNELKEAALIHTKESSA